MNKSEKEKLARAMKILEELNAQNADTQEEDVKNTIEAYKKTYSIEDRKPMTLGGHPIVEDEQITIVYEGRTYNRFNPCKYKCGLWTSWATDYKKGDKILHINPMTKEIAGFNCPKYTGGT